MAAVNIPVEGSDTLPLPTSKNCSNTPQFYMDEKKAVRMLLELYDSDLSRIQLLTDRLGIVCKDDVIRYCLAQVTWWVLSGPMAGASAPSHVSTTNSNSGGSKYGYQ